MVENEARELWQGQKAYLVGGGEPSKGLVKSGITRIDWTKITDGLEARRPVGHSYNVPGRGNDVLADLRATDDGRRKEVIWEKMSVSNQQDLVINEIQGRECVVASRFQETEAVRALWA